LSTPPLDPATHRLIWEYAQQGLSIRQTINILTAQHGLHACYGTVQKWRTVPPVKLSYQAPGIRSDKKRGSLDWEEWSYKIEEMQGLKRKASQSQDHALIELGDGLHDVALGSFSDQHMGSWGCNYADLRRLTHEIVNTPNFYIAALGDEGQYAIKLRNVLEVSDNAIPPEMQTQFIQSWWDTVWQKVACATWDNHGIERQETAAGESALKNIKSKRVVYFNGIGHVDIKVGNQIYRGAVSHTFRGRSLLNPCHSQMRYMRFEGVDREWCMAGDSHVPGMIKYTDGAKTRVAINGGSLQNNSGFGKRYFSLTTHPAYPIIVFHHDRHEMSPFWSVKEWLKACGKEPQLQ